jgi:hypothetical protein
MSRTFTKLFSSITESTVWCEPDRTRLVWICMLSMADRLGRVWASVPGLANRARVPVDDVRIAIETFLSPDPDSRTPDYEGRRIEVIDGGWRLLNHEKYRNIRDEESILESKRKYINKRRAAERLVENVDIGRPPYTQAEADTEAEAYKSKPSVRATRLPPDYELTEESKAFAKKQQPTWTDDHLKTVFENFRDYWVSAPKGAKLDWAATWRTWVRKEKPLPTGSRPIIRGEKTTAMLNEYRTHQATPIPDVIRATLRRKPTGET